MRHNYYHGLCLGACLLASAIVVDAQQRIGVSEGNPMFYAVGATDANKGVYKLPLEGEFPEVPEKISTTTIGGMQWSFQQSGGTFISKEKAVGSAFLSGSRYYVVIATSDGDGENGPWSHSYYSYRNDNLEDYNYTFRATDMTYDAASDKVYAWCYYNSYGISTALAVFNAEAQTVEFVGSASYTQIDALAIDANGQLWGIAGQSGMLYKIDKSNGAMTEAFSLGVSSYNGSNQSAAFDPSTGKLYWGAANMYSNYLYVIDVEAQSCELVYNFPAGKKFNGFYIPGPDTKSGAPAAPENLSAAYTGTATDMLVSFNAPTLSYGGVELTGELTYHIQVDGSEVATGAIQPGDEYSESMTMTEGLHSLTVYLSNEVGDGTPVSVDAHAGYDEPAAVTDLAANVDGSSATLTWKAPMGKNGGLVDMSKVAYSVSRNGVEIATSVTDTEYTDTLDEAPMAEYVYNVTVVFDGEAGDSVSTDGLLIGTPYSIPFKQDFEEIETLGSVAFKAICEIPDNCNDWQMNYLDGNKCVSLSYMTYGTVYDHLFTSPLQLLSGVTYTLKFKVACNVVGESPAMRVNLSKSQSLNSDDYIYPWIVSKIKYTCNADNVGQFIELSYDFTVEEDGVYFIDFYDTTNSWNYDSAVYLDDIEITGAFPTPKAVADFAATPQREGSRNIDLSFTTPAVDVNENPLENITKVEISANGELIATLDKIPNTENAITPGCQITYTIENAPRGEQNYEVVVYNDIFASEPAVASAISGYMDNLSITDESFPENIAIDGAGIASVTIFNDAANTAADFRVVLLADGEEVQSLQGNSLEADREDTYTFDIVWEETSPESVVYSIAVELSGDEYTDDNTTDDHVVTFEQKPVISIDELETGKVNVTAHSGEIIVENAAGMKIAVYTADGRLIVAADNASQRWSKRLASGAYIVVAGTTRHKVLL